MVIGAYATFNFDIKERGSPPLEGRKGGVIPESIFLAGF
jgi:hypothetical protein